MYYNEWLDAMSEKEQLDFNINGYGIYDFLLGDDTPGNVK
eukprot:CAMPEP_0168322508 /NCGR_PEP_ID=MMETSP0213-20121227/2925_1 /TAXON_ID=151035 /ORGANISM="Euplotes harpa, Strain FSP1.4" /LENGTH=39 /DNA_ID= /DNA_START= /DNA_END= /DNA_ORIENTATION=